MFKIILCFGGFFLSVVLAIVLERYEILPNGFYWGVVGVVFTFAGFSLGKWIDARSFVGLKGIEFGVRSDNGHYRTAETQNRFQIRTLPTEGIDKVRGAFWSAPTCRRFGRWRPVASSVATGPDGRKR